MRKRHHILIAATVAAVAAGGCAGRNDDTAKAEASVSAAAKTSATTTSTTYVAPTTTSAPPRTFDQASYGDLASSPDTYKNSRVDVVGKVFGEVQTQGENAGFQIWVSPKNSQWNTVVWAYGKAIPKTDDYVHVVGVVDGSFSGTNGFGATVTAPKVVAEVVEIVDATALASPAQRTARGRSIDQNGLVVTVDRVDFAADETRVWVKVKNNTPNKATFFSFNANALQGAKQFDHQNTYGSDYPEVQSELLPGVESSGIVVFPPIPAGSVTFSFEGRSENYRLDFTPYTFALSS